MSSSFTSLEELISAVVERGWAIRFSKDTQGSEPFWVSIDHRFQHARRAESLLTAGQQAFDRAEITKDFPPLTHGLMPPRPSEPFDSSSFLKNLGL